MVPVFSAHCKSLTGNQKASQINTFIFMAASWHCLFCFNPKFLYIYIFYYIIYIYICPHTHTYIYIYIYISYIIYMISGKCSKNWHFFPPTPCFFSPCPSRRRNLRQFQVHSAATMNGSKRGAFWVPGTSRFGVLDVDSASFMWGFW